MKPSFIIVLHNNVILLFQDMHSFYPRPCIIISEGGILKAWPCGFAYFSLYITTFQRHVAYNTKTITTLYLISIYSAINIFFIFRDYFWVVLGSQHNWEVQGVPMYPSSYTCPDNSHCQRPPPPRVVHMLQLKYLCWNFIVTLNPLFISRFTPATVLSMDLGKCIKACIRHYTMM